MHFKLTVVTAVLNGRKTLQENLDSVHSETSRHRVNQLIVDGGSTDGSLALVEQSLRQHRYSVEVHPIPVSGISNAFNAGIANANGDYVSFLNSDDRYVKGALDKVLRRIEEGAGSADVYFGNIVYQDPISAYQYEEKARLENIPKFMSIYHPAMFFRREALESLVGFKNDYQLAMDAELVHRAIKKGMTFESLDFNVAVMRLGGASHQHYILALNEYRRSIVMNGLQTPLRAAFYFLRQITIHFLLRIPQIKNIRSHAAQPPNEQ